MSYNFFLSYDGVYKSSILFLLLLFIIFVFSFSCLGEEVVLTATPHRQPARRKRSIVLASDSSDETDYAPPTSHPSSGEVTVMHETPSAPRKIQRFESTAVPKPSIDIVKVEKQQGGT